MSPVHSLSASRSQMQRRRVTPTTVGLFPECPDISSTNLVNDCLTGDHKTVGCGSISDQATMDGPPSSGTQYGTQSRETRPLRNAAAVSLARAPARLVGIASLAAPSPPADTQRGSAEKAGNFVLAVKPILN